MVIIRVIRGILGGDSWIFMYFYKLVYGYINHISNVCITGIYQINSKANSTIRTAAQYIAGFLGCAPTSLFSFKVSGELGGIVGNTSSSVFC